MNIYKKQHLLFAMKINKHLHIHFFRKLHSQIYKLMKITSC